MKNLGIIIALRQETQGLFKNVDVVYSGIGKVNASIAATRLICEHRVTHVLNLGTAGSNRFPTHSLIECTAFIQRDMDLSPLGAPVGHTPLDPLPGIIQIEPIFPHLQKGTCGTGDSFEVGLTKVPCDLVDMEAFAIAKTCARFGVRFNSVKYITDGSDHNAHQDWMQNLRPASAELYKIYEKFLETINSSL